MIMILRLLTVMGLLLLVGCATSPPRQVNNICSIFAEKPGWYASAKKSQKRWGSSIPLMMAFMHQESRFKATAKPPRDKIFGFIPGPRKSSAYGYSQAQTSTWDWYKKDTGNWSYDRDDFGDGDARIVGRHHKQTVALAHGQHHAWRHRHGRVVQHILNRRGQGWIRQSRRSGWDVEYRW